MIIHRIYVELSWKWRVIGLASNGDGTYKRVTLHSKLPNRAAARRKAAIAAATYGASVVSHRDRFKGIKLNEDRGRTNYGTTVRTDRPTIKPAPWPNFPSDADDDYCPVCRESYKKFRPGISYEGVAAGLPLAGQSKRAGYQRAHHGDVLRTMGVMKTNAWRERHGYCTFDVPERPIREDDPSTWGEPPPRPTEELICFQAKGAPKCIIGKRRKRTGKGRPPQGGAECREIVSGKYTDQCAPKRTKPVKRRKE